MNAVPNQQIGDYRILERLGVGGMGVVHLAEHITTGGRYALKTLLGVLDPESVLRFQREAQGHARADAHPNVVRIHTFGRYPGGLYIVMDLIDGGSLAQRLKAETLSPTEGARIVRECARGLAHVHASGVLHRDLKPDNILLDGAAPKLVDFGLAKVIGEDSLTVSGAVVGTPAYMAPEQIDSTRGELGSWTDVYGLGAVLYHCLTGRAPFGGGSAVAVLASSLKRDPPAPRSLRKDIPAALEAICRRALHKAPEQRFQTAEDLARELDRFLAGEGQTRQGRGPLVVGAVGLLGVATAISVWAVVSSPGPAPTHEIAVPPPAPAQDVEPSAQDQRPAVPPPAELPLPALTKAQVMLPQEVRACNEARRLEHAGEHAKAAKIFERLLRDPITGRVRSDPARRLGRLLRDGSGVPRDPVRAAALLFEAALSGEHKAVRKLGLSHLSPELLGFLRAKTISPVRAPRLGDDDVLAATCVRIYLERSPQNTLTSDLGRVLEQNGFSLPDNIDEAYERLWNSFARRYPGRARALISDEAPPLPIPNGSPLDPLVYHDVQARAKEAKAKAVVIWEEVLFDSDGLLRANVAQRQGYALCNRSSLEEKDRGVDLLMESALRGDSESALAICLEYLPDDIRKAALLSERVVPVEPDLELAAACGKLAEGVHGNLARAVGRILERKEVSTPGTKRAYLVLWKYYVARRLARTR